MNSNMCIVKHTLNTVYVLADLFICATPIRILHLVYPVLFGFVYSLFNSVYFLAENEGHNGKEYTYKVMHWTDAPLKAIAMCAMGLFVSALVQVGLWVFYEFRVSVHRRCTHSQELTAAPADDSCTAVVVTSYELSTSGVNKKRQGSFKSGRSTNDTIATSLAESECMLPSDSRSAPVAFTDHSKLFDVMETGLLQSNTSSDVTKEENQTDLIGPEMTHHC